MKIKIKGIYHERTEDAPFVGALVCANDCNFNCKGCFNQHLKLQPTIEIDDTEIINNILLNPFNKGIILGGLEWTLQPVEMLKLIKLSLNNKLEVILYTGMDEKELKMNFPQLMTLPIYIKCGKYIEELHTNNYEIYNVKLYSRNQTIIKCH